jgi:hypothetical protein
MEPRGMCLSRFLGYAALGALIVCLATPVSAATCDGSGSDTVWGGAGCDYCYNCETQISCENSCYYRPEFPDPPDVP